MVYDLPQITPALPNSPGLRVGRAGYSDLLCALFPVAEREESTYTILCFTLYYTFTLYFTLHVLSYTLFHQHQNKIYFCSSCPVQFVSFTVSNFLKCTKEPDGFTNEL